MARSCNGFLNCFRPMRPDEQKMSAPMSGADNSSYVASDGKRRGHQKTLRGLRRLAKAVLFETSLAKMIRRKKSQHKSQINESPNSTEISPTNDLKTSSNYFPPCYWLNPSSSTTSSTPFFSPSGSPDISTTSLGRNKYSDHKRAKQMSSRKILMGKNQGLALGQCLFLICLLIFWGKVCAIFFTSVLLVLVPSRVKRVSLVSHGRVGSREVNLKV